MFFLTYLSKNCLFILKESMILNIIEWLSEMMVLWIQAVLKMQYQSISSKSDVYFHLACIPWFACELRIDVSALIITSGVTNANGERGSVYCDDFYKLPQIAPASWIMSLILSLLSLLFPSLILCLPLCLPPLSLFSLRAILLYLNLFPLSLPPSLISPSLPSHSPPLPISVLYLYPVAFPILSCSSLSLPLCSLSLPLSPFISFLSLPFSLSSLASS